MARHSWVQPIHWLAGRRVPDWYPSSAIAHAAVRPCQVDKLKTISEYAISKYGMHVIIGLHSLPGGVNGLDIGSVAPFFPPDTLRYSPLIKPSLREHFGNNGWSVTLPLSLARLLQPTPRQALMDAPRRALQVVQSDQPAVHLHHRQKGHRLHPVLPVQIQLLVLAHQRASVPSPSRSGVSSRSDRILLTSRPQPRTLPALCSRSAQCSRPTERPTSSRTTNGSSARPRASTLA